MNEYDHVIENNELNVCVRKIQKIITKKRIKELEKGIIKIRIYVII